MKEAYCSYEVSKLLKEKGYIKISNVDFVANDEDCYSAPTHKYALENLI